MKPHARNTAGEMPTTKNAARKANPGEALHQRIARRDRIMARAAPAAQQKPADHGDVVVAANGGTAARTMRPGGRATHCAAACR